MKFKNLTEDIAALPQAYQEYFHCIAQYIPDERIITDPVRTFAYGVVYPR